MQKDEVIKKIKDLKELKLMIEELQAEITLIENEIKSKMTEQNKEELHVGMFKIKWASIKSNRFDISAFKGKYKELYNQFIKVVETKRFTIV